MFAGKTTELVKEYRRHESCGFECLFINHKIDNRYVDEENKTSTKPTSFVKFRQTNDFHAVNENGLDFAYMNKDNYLHSNDNTLFIAGTQTGRDWYDNIKNIPFALEVGQRLFQLVGMDGSEINFELVKNLSASARGSGGFGSTGK